MNSPRFTGLKNKENTERAIKRGYLAPVYAATIALATSGFDPINAYHLVNPGLLTGALTVTAPVGTTTTGPLIGDVLEFLFVSDATGRTVTFGTGFAASAATLVIAASKYGTAEFIFNGTIWVEKSRTLTV